jgi:signal transduction histidine kinase
MPGMSISQQHDLGNAAADEELLGTAGLLHDLGHQLMTLSLLAEAVGGDEELTAESRRRIELVQQEMLRAMDLIADHMVADGPVGTAGDGDLVDLRDLSSQVAALAELAYGATVRVLPGPAARLGRAPALLWRVLSNVVDNAARAAGPGGQVEVSIRQEIDTVIDVFDDGPGFGNGPGGIAGLGLTVVRRLLEDADGRLEVAERADGGTRVRVVFCRERDCAMVPAGAGTWH